MCSWVKMVVECQIDLDNIVNATIVFGHFPIFLEFQIADFAADPAPCLVNHPGYSQHNTLQAAFWPICFYQKVKKKLH